jgi:uncharacterized protein YraI
LPFKHEPACVICKGRTIRFASSIDVEPIPLKETLFMKLKSILAGTAFLAVLTAATGAFAAPGVTIGPAHMRAGPSRDYPLVASLPPNVPLNVGGCVNGWSWCDVSWQGVHGWVAGSRLGVYRHRHPVAIVSAGPVVGVPFVVFNQEDYWGHYYHNRPWYGNHPDWHHDAPPPGPGPGFDHGPGGPGQGPGPGGPGPRPDWNHGHAYDYDHDRGPQGQ